MGPSLLKTDLPLKEQFRASEIHSVEQPIKAKLSQARHQLSTAESEINELRQSLRYVEISLAKQREEKEASDEALRQSKAEQEVMAASMAEKDKEMSLLEGQVVTLSKKITKFNSNNDQIKEKNQFKATRYQGEINKQEEEVIKMRDRMLEVEETLKHLTLMSEKFKLERDYLHKELKVSEVANRELQGRLTHQSRLLTNVSTHNKNHGDVLREVESSGSRGGDRAKIEAQRSERIAMTMNRGAFMPLGENPPKLYSEQDPALTRQLQIEPEMNENDPFMDKNHLYLTDDSIPTPVYQCIDAYRQKIRMSGSGANSLLIDDFFGEVHNIMKDTHLREIARIRNENTVEIMRLKKAVAQKDSARGMTPSTSQSTFREMQGQLGKTSFADNEIEKQRRTLMSQNIHLDKRVKALENLLRTETDGRKKFMEGAHWLAIKSKGEQEKLSNKLVEIAQQFVAMNKAALQDPRRKDYDGQMVENTMNWIVKQIQRHTDEANESYGTLSENVNFFLNEANSNLKLK